MGAKIKKGLFKPLRYFSQMFDNKELELQIGFPTNVKHVAHIGWDRPNVNAPTWLSETWVDEGVPLCTTQLTLLCRGKGNPSNQSMGFPKASHRPLQYLKAPNCCLPTNHLVKKPLK